MKTTDLGIILTFYEIMHSLLVNIQSLRYLYVSTKFPFTTNEMRVDKY